ncbi:MAG: hypothetical protein COB02_15245 [Candidatus Cloacimonadota bacterium]|nr:MAG: hypothetical protein COB02_15245 [Candidatus Cloacimonadota bacterium]
MKLLFFIIIFSQIPLSFTHATNKKDHLKNKITIEGIELIKIPEGKFMMGSLKSEVGSIKNERPRHNVEITKAFYMGIYEVTQEQWKTIMGDNPSGFLGDDLPVEQVSWNDVRDFIIKLNEKVSCVEPDTLILLDESGVEAIPSSCFRLPTEAEWEYAARAGTTSVFSFGDRLSVSKANYYGDYPYADGEKGLYREKTIRVGSFGPNLFGLYDMHGNVWEWCHDGYAQSYYGESDLENPNGSKGGPNTVLRGGSWSSSGKALRSASRYYKNPDDDFYSIGFRLVFTQ